ncbi:MAG: TadE/TadG family type IV pilus assembly protein [Planctomycetaceae bacterium]
MRLNLRSRKLCNTQRGGERAGAVLVETAVVLPIFFTFIFAFIEFGHCFMTIHTLNSAARRAARLGVAEDTTTDDVHTLAHQILDSAIDADLENVQIWIKDASIFDTPNVETESIDYEDLDDIEVADIETRQLFLVRIQVPYSEVGILGPRWITSLNLYGQAVMRKE